MVKANRISGQGLVEFVLILPILLLLTLGALDIGRAFFMKVVLENSAREGAYYMIYNNKTETRANNFNLVKVAVQIEAENSGVTIPLENIDVKCMDGAFVNNTCPGGSTVIVAVRSDLALILDFFSSTPLVLTNDARMLIQ